MTVLMFDASYPPTTAPHGYSVVAGYIGGHTPHVWTNAEWARFDGLRKLPIWVPGPAVGVTEDAINDGFAILDAVYRLKVPKGSPIVLDMETSVAASFDTALEDVLVWAGYRPWVYGSLSTIRGNPLYANFGGYWVADYTGVPHFTGIANERACQYGSGNVYDSSEVKPWQYENTLKSW